jgi:hypothetical protein
MGRSIFVPGNEFEAEFTWCKALRVAQETVGTFLVLEALTGLASIYALRGDRENALELLLAVLEHPAIIIYTRVRAPNLSSELETQLTSQQKQADLATGSSEYFRECLSTIT